MKGLIIASVLCLAGCSDMLRPDYVYANYVHQSQPFQGKGIPPFGDNGNSDETNYDGIETGLRWESGALFSESSVTYMVRDSGIVGNQWAATLRMGVRVKLP